MAISNEITRELTVTHGYQAWPQGHPDYLPPGMRVRVVLPSTLKGTCVGMIGTLLTNLGYVHAVPSYAVRWDVIPEIYATLMRQEEIAPVD